MTDASGAEILRLTYDPYRQVLTRNGAAVASQGFGTGEDLGHGLVLLGARWYAPRLGRFISPDPTGVALAVGGVSVTWGAVFAATVIGIVAGGVIGGIAAARADGDAGDIFLGVVVGGAVGGWAAFGAAFAGVAVAGALGLTGDTVAAGAVVGGVAGTINGAAMGFASGFAGRKNNGLKDIMLKVMVGAVTGLALGAALGALSGVVAPKDSVGTALSEAAQPDPVPAGGPVPGGGLTGPPPPVNSVGAALGQTATSLGARGLGEVAPYIAAMLAPAAGNAILFYLTVDGASAVLSEEFDDLQNYLQTHSVNLGPFNFVKTDF